MAEGLGSAGANTELDTVLAAYPWLKLHIGAPGAAGTSNPASNTTRKQATWGAAAAGSAVNSNAPTWTAVPTTETYTHFSAWTASGAGTFGYSGTIASGSVTSGNDFDLPIGSIAVSHTLAS